MRVIWKYPMENALQKLELPGGARVLTVQMQGNVPTLWADVDPEAEVDIRYFEAIGTGHSFEPDSASARMSYIATIQQGPFVWHYFERIYS